MQIAMRQYTDSSEGTRPVSFGDHLYFMSTENRARQSSYKKKNVFSNDFDQNQNKENDQNRGSEKGKDDEKYEILEGDEAPDKR